MSSRAVWCVVLQAAVLACPMWCKLGACGACHSASAGEPRVLAETAPGSGPAGHCPRCAPRSADEQQSQPEQSPARPASDPHCQGVCGGAILSQAVDIPAADGGPQFTLPADLCAADRTAIAAGDFAPERAHCGASPGRALRIAQHSFLC